MPNKNPVVVQKTNEFDKHLVNVEPGTGLELKNTFMPFFEDAEKCAEEANKIKITDASQVEEIALAREIRLKLKKVRNNTENKRKALKEQSLRTGKAIDGMANIIKYLVVPIEEHLQAQEDFVKNQEKERLEKLREDRESRLKAFDVETGYYNLAEMSEEGFQQLLQSSKIVYDNKQEEIRLAEEAQLKAEKDAEEAKKRIAKENERLKKEARTRELAIEKERKQQEKVESERKAKEDKQQKAHVAILERECKAREIIEKELRERKETEEKIERERLEKEKALKLAPDKKKLEALAVTITGLEMPEVTSKEAKDIVANAVELLNKTSNYIKQRCVDL